MAKMQSYINVFNNSDTSNNGTVPSIDNAIPGEVFVETQPTNQEQGDDNNDASFSRNAQGSLNNVQGINNNPILQEQIASNVQMNSSRNHNNSILQEQSIKLPIIKLPVFRAQYEKWYEFRDAFRALVHNNTYISDIQKYYYLKSSVEGDAAEVIQSIEVSADNYSLAWRLLEERFENKRLIVHNHVKSIFDSPRLQKESHVELRRLFDNITKHLRSLKCIGEPVDSWDTLLIHIIVNKFDVTTRRDWESYDKIEEGQTPKMSDLNKFLRSKCELLEKLQLNKLETRAEVQLGKFKGRSNAHVSTSNIKCFFCKESHSVYYCQTLLKLPVASRIKRVKDLKLCINCLRPNHTSNNCNSSTCKKCNKRHNSLLCQEVEERPSSQVQDRDQESQVFTAGHTTNSFVSTQVVLSTAMVECVDIHGRLHNARCLLDNGSQSNFITEKLCQQLGLRKIKVDYAVKGVGEALSNIKYKVQFRIRSCINEFNTSISCLVLPAITEELPSVSFDTEELNIPRKIRLADPTFNKRGPIDMLIGSDIFWQLLTIGQIKLGADKPLLQKTLLGWVVAGKLSSCAMASQVISCCVTAKNADDNFLMRFWEIEECATLKKSLSVTDEYCESHFKETHKRDAAGRFIVSIPFTDDLKYLGHSRQQALNRFSSLERKLEKNPHLKQDYTEFIQEYLNLGHMSRIHEEDKHDEQAYYLPHHAVLRESSLTTKIRIVFDASMKTDSGLSLNDVQHAGPTIQDDVFSILLRFRKHKYVMTSDISKMYRMILVDRDERRFQRIFWRSNPSEEIECFQLNTVTYGTSSAPFLAVRCLWQLAEENAEMFPMTSEIIKRDFYMDDLLTGADSREVILQIQEEISKILSSAGFDLRKWLCNEPELLNKFKVDSNMEASVLTLGEDQQNKTLGIFWNATSDTLQYSINIQSTASKLSKRIILSMMSQIFDPLGLLGPVIIAAKLMIQKLWQAGITWDETVPQEIYTRWVQFRRNLSVLNQVKVPRHIGYMDMLEVELHGFSDASEQAYGACVYVRCKLQDGYYTSRLLCAKSRVAPLKKITLPRLELCGALLLANLMKRVQESMNLQVKKYYLWCDSTIALAWIRACPTRWKTFVSNRVSEIQKLTSLQDWHHVVSKENPADLLTRGVQEGEFLDCNLWWEGPTWLSENEWNSSEDEIALDYEEMPEMRMNSFTALKLSKTDEIIEKFSSLNRLRRVVAYCFRFVNNCRTKLSERKLRELEATEIANSMKALLRSAQIHSFPLEYEALLKGKSVSKSSHVLSLNPFMDSDKLIRVGGRISKASCSFNRKHPLILSTKHALTKLIFRHEHIRLLHCGPQHLLASIREQYWPIAGRDLARQTVHKCITCFKAKPVSEPYLMGNLPSMRVNQYIPFTHTGVDYAGPYHIKDRKSRPAKLVKCYVCMFICMTTKAVHIEVVSDLSSNAFILMFKRFVARRGRPSNIYSDNGTSFVGANSQLRELKHFFDSEARDFLSYLSDEEMQWHFIPPRSPNFGGLWEAGIKSMKHHLKRVVGNASLNLEEFITVLTQVEAILNSRPLSPLSSDSSDFNPLTPAHFLVGKALTAIPEPCLLDVSESRLNNYQKLQQIIQHFWQRWHREYLSELQTRVKWKVNYSQMLKKGDLVLIREENVPQLKWPLGRITEVHPGNDNVIRVVSVGLPNGVVKRAVSKICVLPCND